MRHPIAYNANSLYPQHPTWPLPRRAPRIRPRGHTRQRDAEGSTGPARGKGVTIGSANADGASTEGEMGCRGNHWFGMDPL